MNNNLPEIYRQEKAQSVKSATMTLIVAIYHLVIALVKVFLKNVIFSLALFYICGIYDLWSIKVPLVLGVFDLIGAILSVPAITLTRKAD